MKNHPNIVKMVMEKKLHYFSDSTHTQKPKQNCNNASVKSLLKCNDCNKPI